MEKAPARRQCEWHHAQHVTEVDCGYYGTQSQGLWGDVWVPGHRLTLPNLGFALVCS